MGCAASTNRAERRRRGQAQGHSEASTAGLLVARHQNGQQESVSVSVAAAGRRRGCKVAPEPREEEEPAAALAMPGSPSFRFYCHKLAAVDALVAAADADSGDSNGSVRITETPQAIKKNDLAHNTSDLSKSKEVNRWLKFRGLAIVAAAVCSLFSRHSAPTAAGKSHHPCAASAPPAAAAISSLTGECCMGSLHFTSQLVKCG